MKFEEMNKFLFYAWVEKYLQSQFFIDKCLIIYSLNIIFLLFCSFCVFSWLLPLVTEFLFFLLFVASLL